MKMFAELTRPLAILNRYVLENGLAAMSHGLSLDDLASASETPRPRLLAVLAQRAGQFKSDRDQVFLSRTGFMGLQSGWLIPDEVEEVAKAVQAHVFASVDHVGHERPMPYAELKAATGADDLLLQYVLLFFQHVHQIIEPIPADPEKWDGIVHLNARAQAYALQRSAGPVLQLFRDPRGLAAQKDAEERLRKLRTEGEKNVTKWVPPEIKRTEVDVLESIIGGFHRAACVLRDHHPSDKETFSISDEYGAQHLMHALLCTWFADVRREEWTPSLGGAASRMDFLIKDASVAVELKFVHAKMTAKQLGDELSKERDHFAKHASVRSLWYVVYDPELRLGPAALGLEADLSQPYSIGSKAVDVRTRVVPKS